MSDPRKARTLEEAARNSNGTYDGAKALSWLSRVIGGGSGISEKEVLEIWAELKEKKERNDV